MTIYRPLVLYMVVLELRVVRIIRIMESGEWDSDPQPGGSFYVIKNCIFGKKATIYFLFLGPVVLGWPQRLL